MTISRAVAAACLGALIWAGFEFARPAGHLRDFGSFVASGKAAAEGQNPYGIYPLTFHVVLPGFDVWNPNLNPPVSLLAFEAMSGVNPDTAFRSWWMLSLVCYAATLMVLFRRQHSWLLLLWAAALAGFWDTLALGQIYVPLVLAAVVAWRCLENGRPVGAGILIGIVVAGKPNFAVWPVLLLLAGHASAGATAAATFAVLWTVPLWVYGPSVYRHWFDLLVSDRGRAAFVTNASLPGLAQRLDLPIVGAVASVVVLAVLAVWARRRRPGDLDVSTLGILGGLVASPIAWVHYTLFLLPIFFSRGWNSVTWIAALLLVVPVPWVLRTLGAPVWQQLTFGSVYSWAVLLLFVSIASQTMAASVAPKRVESVPRPLGAG